MLSASLSQLLALTSTLIIPHNSKTSSNNYTYSTVHFTLNALAVIVGGIDMMSQSLALAKKPHIIVGKYTIWLCIEI